MRTNPEFIAITKALQSDKSKDVTHFLEGIRFDEEELKSPEDLSNGKIKSTSPLKSLSKSQINGNLNNLNEEIRIEVLKLNEEKRIEELKLNEEKKTEELKLNAEKRIEEFKLKTESEIIEEIRKLELVLNSSEKILKKLEITQSIKEKLLDEKENSIIIKDSGITEENLTDNKQEDVFEVNKKESLDKEYNGKEDEKVIKEEKL